MKRVIGTSIGKSVRHITRLRKGAGQALPGLVIERLIPGYYAAMLKQLPEGVVVITGTNGKTTTTKMVVALLRANGKRVLTNPTGSNLTRGINSTLISQASARGSLPFDIAVLELDEAYARLFAKKVPVRWVLALNVTRDQLDRFGEVDTAAAMITDTMSCATEGIAVNADDVRLFSAAKIFCGQTKLALTTFRVADAIKHRFPTDNELVSVSKRPSKSLGGSADITLEQFDGQHATYLVDDKAYSAHFALSGQHNFQNAAAAMSLVHALLPQVRMTALVQQLAQVEPAFGRGEVFRTANGGSLRMVLVKNPAGFRQSLASYLPTNASVMVAINDNIADGRDVSWLWDVDFAPLRDTEVFCTSGSRAADMAIRLQYDDIHTKCVISDLGEALDAFSALPGDKLLFTTYTPMLWFYRTLSAQEDKHE